MEGIDCPSDATKDSVLRVANCYQMTQLYQGRCGWNNAYCVEVLVICLMSLINCVLLSYLLTVDM